MAPHPSPAELRAFRATLVGTFTTSVGLGLTLPFTFVYFDRVLGLSLPLVGAVVAAASVLALAAGGWGGAVADRVGLGRVAVLGLTVQAAGTLVLAAAREPVVGAVGLAVLSMGNSLVWPSLNGLVTHQVSAERRSRAFAVRFGLMNAGMGAGSLLAAATVSTSEPGSFHVVYAVDGATTAVFALLLLVRLRGTAGWSGHGDRSTQVAPSTYATVLRDRTFLAHLAVLLAVAVFGSAQAEGPWAAYVALTPHGTAQVVGLAFAANTAAIVVLQLPVERRTRNWRRSRLLVACALCAAAAWVLTGLAGLPGTGPLVTAVLAVCALGVFGVGETFLSPVINAMPNALAPDHLRGRYNALNSATYPVSKLVGPPLAGVLIGSGAPASWVVAVVLGAVLTAAAAVALGRRLPREVEFPAPSPRPRVLARARSTGDRGRS